MEKKSWSGEKGFILAASGAAVGLGNIWSFPRHMASGNGGAFLTVYLLLAALVGFPLLTSELAAGRETASKPRAAFRKLTGSSAGGIAGECASLLMMGFYSVIGGCCLRYMLKCFTGVFSPETDRGLSLFLEYISDVPKSAFYTLLFIILTALISAAGVSKGLERFSRFAVPVLFVMLPGMILSALSLPGSDEGFRLMFAVPERVSAMEFLGIFGAAAAQMFFSLSLGQGVMLTYGAYLPPEVNITKCALAVVLTDTAAALLAAFAVVPMVPAGMGKSSDGAMMLFVTMQRVFGIYGAWGSMLGFLFYFLVLLAALTSAVSLLEVISSFAGENAGRVPAVIFAAALSAIPATAIARDGMGFGSLPEIFSMSWLDATELMAETLLMPLSTLFLICALGKNAGEAMLRRQLGAGNGTWTHFAVKFFAPTVLIAVIVSGIVKLI